MIIAGERDETLQYVENLRRAGGTVDFEIYKGCYYMRRFDDTYKVGSGINKIMAENLLVLFAKK